KNDPSTEPNDPLNAWRSYVAAYELEGHTEDIPALTYPNGTLLRNIPASLTADPTAAPDVADARSTAMDETLARLNGTLAVNQLEMRIWVENNRSTFLKERADTLLAPRAMAEGGKEGAAEREQLAEIRAAGIVERLVQNNGAMKGLSKEEVERKNEEWRVLVEDGVGVGGGVGVGAGGVGEEETGEE
ncbi:Transcriptional regulatory protein sin3, partial [Elasticomyces elasticus]